MMSLLIFDMDGVLIESVDAKNEAFQKLFSGYPDKIDEIIHYNNKNPGLSRFQKVPYIYENILNKRLDKATEICLLSQLKNLINEAMIEVSLVPGCIDFFERYSKQVPCAVVSAAPEEDAVSVLTKKGISHYFSPILGSPITKQDNIIKILQYYQVKPDNAFMIGDSVSDHHAAQDVGCPFIARVQEGKQNPFSGISGVSFVIHDFYDLITLFFGES